MSEERPEGAHFKREVLPDIHARLRPSNYLEIGVAAGGSIVACRPGTRAVGVDPKPRLEIDLPETTTIFEMESDAFFAEHDVKELLGGPIDLAFIDGLHHFDQALRDFINVERNAHPRTVVLVHDWYPGTRRVAERDRRCAVWAGDVWKLALLLRAHRPDLSLATLDAAPTGLGVITGLDPSNRLLAERHDALVEEYLALDYAILRGRKHELLNVVETRPETLDRLLAPALG